MNFPGHRTMLSLSYLFFFNIPKSVMMTLWVHSFGVIWIMISDPRSLTCLIKGTNESATREDSSFCVSFLKIQHCDTLQHILKNVSHSFKPNQAPGVASSAGYIISCMSQLLCKVLCSCTGTQIMKCFPGVNFTSLALDKLRTQFHLVT